MIGRARVAWNLRRLRTDRAISQEDLAVDAEIDVTYISGIERQKFNPSIDVLDRLAGALNVDISVLLVKPAASDKPPKTLKRGRRPAV